MTAAEQALRCLVLDNMPTPEKVLTLGDETEVDGERFIGHHEQSLGDRTHA